MESSKNKARSPLISELYYGIFKKWYKYIPLVFISLFFSLNFYSKVKFIAAATEVSINPSFADFLINIFNGMHIYIPTPGKPFEIPILWFITNIYIAFTIFSYITKDLNEFGKSVLLQAQSRPKWYLRKCVWAFCNVVVCFIMIILPPLFMSIAVGNFSFIPTSSAILREKLFADYAAVNLPLLLLHLLLLPLLTSLALSLLQVLLELILNPIWGFTAVAMILIVSAYFYSPFLIGNVSMLLRSNLIMENGVSFLHGIFVVSFTAFISCLCGVLRFKKYDVV